MCFEPDLVRATGRFGSSNDPVELEQSGKAWGVRREKIHFHSLERQ